MDREYKPKPLREDELQRLSEDPKNVVYKHAHKDTREPWDMSEAIEVFRGIHTAFVAHCAANDESEDSKFRKRAANSNDERTALAVKEHPTLFGTITSRKSALSPNRMHIIWSMFALHAAVANGTMTDEQAQQRFAQQSLPHMVDQANQ